MITEIGYADGRYFIWADGHCVDTASTQHEADVLLSTIQEAEASWQMGGMEMSQSFDNLYNRATPYTWEELCDELGIRNTVSGDPHPLLAQCAKVIRACLGGPVATSGIVDELRRVERALAKAGW